MNKSYIIINQHKHVRSNVYQKNKTALNSVKAHYYGAWLSEHGSVIEPTHYVRRSTSL